MSLKTIFFGPTHKALARKISIKSPGAFRESISELKKNGLTTTEKRALVLAKNRASAQLHRKNLSGKERKQFRSIAHMKLY